MNQTCRNLNPNPERTLLNEIAHLTNLLQCSKPVKRLKVQNIRRNTVATFAHGNYRLAWRNGIGSHGSRKRSSFVISNTRLKTWRHQISPGFTLTRKVLSPTDIVADTNTKHGSRSAVNSVPVVSCIVSTREISCQGSSEVQATGSKNPTRYYAMQPKSSPIKSIVQRRLPSDVVQIPSRDENETGQLNVGSSDCNNEKAVSVINYYGVSENKDQDKDKAPESDGFDRKNDDHPPALDDRCQAGSSVFRENSVPNSGDGRIECVVMHVKEEGMKISDVKQHDNSSRRTRLLSKIRKLSSYKERLAGTKSGQSQMPSYFPC